MKLLITILFLLNAVVCAFSQTSAFNVTYEDFEGNIPLSVLVCPDGYITIGTGWSDQIGGWNALKIVKTDFNGNLKWKKYYGQEYWGCFSGYNGSAKRTPDGNFVFSGYVGDSGSIQDFWIMKFDCNGDSLWSRTIDLGGDEYFYNTAIGSNGDIISVGSSNYISNLQEQLYITCHDRDGNFKWFKSYGNGRYDSGYYIENTPDSGYVIGGASEGRGWDGWLVKTDSLANIQWQRYFGTADYDGPLGVAVNHMGGYYVWGWYDSIAPGSMATEVTYLFALDSLGEIVWKQFFPTPYNSKVINRVRVYNEYLFFCGVTDVSLRGDTKGWFTKMDLAGNIIWERQYDNTESNIKGDLFEDFQQTADGGFVLTGSANNPGTLFYNRQDFWLVKVDSNGCLYPTTACVTGITETATLQAKLYPNPTTGALTIELPGGQGGSMALYNLLGQSVYQTTLAGGQNTLALNLPPGLYLYRITGGGKAVNGKLLVE